MDSVHIENNNNIERVYLSEKNEPIQVLSNKAIKPPKEVQKKSGISNDDDDIVTSPEKPSKHQDYKNQSKDNKNQSMTKKSKHLDEEIKADDTNEQHKIEKSSLSNPKKDYVDIHFMSENSNHSDHKNEQQETSYTHLNIDHIDDKKKLENTAEKFEHLEQNSRSEDNRHHKTNDQEHLHHKSKSKEISDTTEISEEHSLVHESQWKNSDIDTDNASEMEMISKDLKNDRIKNFEGLTYDPSDNDSEPEGEYSFTEDQKRAMMELMVQKHEDGDIIDEDPPEYNVKGRLIQLNAELANDPTPVDGSRETKVLFKPEIVDLVAPPPSYQSDDESQPNSARADKDMTSADHKEDTRDNEIKPKSLSNDQYVVERDGNFTVLSSKELTPAEKELFAPNYTTIKKDNDISKTSQRHISQEKNTMPVPKPPDEPRPKTATSGTRRKTVHLVRPRSAAQTINYETSGSDGFEYNSPYAMSKEEKKRAKKDAERLEEDTRKKKNNKQEEENKKQQENLMAFDAWVKRKKEEDKQRREKEAQGKEYRNTKKEKDGPDYKTWLKEKRNQVKQERLLRKRQQQERHENCVIHSQDDCDKAFKEWLKKKNAEIKKQHASDRQKYKFYKLHQRKTRRTLALMKALKAVQSSPYVDFYGYRF